MVSFSQTISHWLTHSNGLANQVALHAAEVWPLAEIYPHLYDAKLMRRWGSMSFDRTQNDGPEISGIDNGKGGMKDSTGTNRKLRNLLIGNRNHLNKKSRTIANQNTSIVLKLNGAELLWGGIVMDPQVAPWETISLNSRLVTVLKTLRGMRDGNTEKS